MELQLSRSLVYGARSWLDHRSRLVAQLLLFLPSGEPRWVDVRTLSDWVALAPAPAEVTERPLAVT